MPLTVPPIDDRTYQQLRDEALARIPVHNPEWTNFAESDPGVTLLEVFAFVAESVLYRANQIPERNRRKFLQLLGVPLAPASAARGLVTVNNDRGPQEVVLLPTGLELLAGSVPFRIDLGIDVLPVEGHVFFKREVTDAAPELRAYYDQLYSSFLQTSLPQAAKLYATVPLTGTAGVDLANETVDGSLWIALAARKADVAGLGADDRDRALDELRGRLAAKTISLGIVPWLTDTARSLTPAGDPDARRANQLVCRIPLPPPDGRLPEAADQRLPRYRALPVVGDDVLARPGVVQVTLPDQRALGLWTNLEPLESGVGDFPPAVDDTNLESRVVTWLRLSVPTGTQARLLWAGINAAAVSQRARIIGERLPDGTGAPDQVVRLSRRPVLAGSVRLFVSGNDTSPLAPVEWTAVPDLDAAGAEIPVVDPRVPPGTTPPRPRESRVFVLDAEAGELRFGDGIRGARAPLGAALVADYEYSEGREGNVNRGAIRTGPSLPPGFSVSNPVATWGGADAETVADGEKQVQRYVQHRDRLVSADDFATITWRTPGVEIGRVDVVPASSPELGINEPGDAPGAVTLMIVPRHDPQQPDAPRPDRLFLDAVCAWLDPRRLVTTEVFLRGPVYKSIWVSVSIDVATERSIPEVRQAAEQALRAALAPLPADADAGPGPLMPVFAPGPSRPGGWPLRRPVVAVELAAVAARVSGVTAVRELLLAGDADTTSQTTIDMRGLELPRVAGLIVTVGPAVPIADLKGTAGAGGPATGTVGFVPLPVVPEEC